MTDDQHLDTRQPLDLSIRELRILHRATKAHRKKLERDLRKSTFVPQPGHRDVAVMTTENARLLEDRLQTELVERFRDLRRAGRIAGVVRING